MATDTNKPIDIKILIFPSVLAVCAMVALTWFPPKNRQQEAILNPTETQLLNPTEVLDSLQDPNRTPSPEIEPIDMREDILDVLNANKIYKNT
jgi:hypothetical protein